MMALENKIRKAVIPAAGKGTRLYPLTRAIPKELIRVGKKPVIHHILDMIKEANISEVLIISGYKKGPLIDYIGSGEQFGLDVYYRVQEEQKGVGHAILQAEKWINSEDFIFVFGDNYIKPYSVMRDLVNFHYAHKSNVTLLLHPVRDPQRFGIVKLDYQTYKALAMIEKPTLKEAESYKTDDEYLTIAGMGILSANIFNYIKRTPIGKNNELQLTDAIELLRKEEDKVYGQIFRGHRFDIGTWESLEEADALNLNSI